jgi:hypothetical protein
VIRSLAILTVVFFLIGMARAWQLIGGRDTGVLHAVRSAIHPTRVDAADTPDGGLGSESPPGPRQ